MNGNWKKALESVSTASRQTGCPMTEAEMTSARQYCEAATAAPWELWEVHAAVFAGPAKENTPHVLSGYRGGICDLDGGCMAEDDLIEGGPEEWTSEEAIFMNRQQNATFIARSRSDFPSALSMLNMAMSALVTITEEGVIGGADHPFGICTCFGCRVRRLVARWKGHQL